MATPDPLTEVKPEDASTSDSYQSGKGCLILTLILVALSALCVALILVFGNH